MHIRMCISAISFHTTLPLVEGNCRNAHTYVPFCHFPPTYPPAGGRKLYEMHIRMCIPAISLNPTLPPGGRRIAQVHIRMCISAISFHPPLPLVEGDCRNAQTYVHFCDSLPPYPPPGGRKLQKCTYVWAFLQFLPPYPPPGGRKS